MSTLKRFLAAIAASRKAVATVAGVVFVLVTPLANYLGAEVTEKQVEYVLGLILGYVVGQGIADHGKEAAKITKGDAS